MSNKTNKTEAKPAAGKPHGVVIAGVNLNSLVWANAADGRKAIAALSKHYDETLKALVPLLSEKNDDATVQASFALDGMTMAALAPNKEAKAEQLCLALSNNFKLAKNNTARCILLKCMDQICASVPVNGDEFFKCLGKCLKAGEPIFTYALNVLRRLYNSHKALELLSNAARKADDRKKAILYAAMMESPSGKWDYFDECYDYALSLKDKPELFRMLCAALAPHGDVTLVDALMELLASKSKVDQGQARRAFLAMCSDCNDFSEYDENDDNCDDCDCDDCDCDDCDCDDCDCDDCDDCDDDCDDFDSQLPTEKVARLFASLEPREPALLGLMSTIGDTREAFEILWECVIEGDQILRLTALKYLAGGFEKMVWTEQILQRTMALKCVEAKADVVRMLGKRGDVAARPYVLSCLRDASPLVRQAALEAASQFPGGNVGGARLSGVVLA